MRPIISRAIGITHFRNRVLFGPPLHSVKSMPSEWIGISLVVICKVHPQSEADAEAGFFCESVLTLLCVQNSVHSDPASAGDACTMTAMITTPTCPSFTASLVLLGLS
eukprot:IDg13471t1